MASNTSLSSALQTQSHASNIDHGGLAAIAEFNKAHDAEQQAARGVQQPQEKSSPVRPPATPSKQQKAPAAPPPPAPKPAKEAPKPAKTSVPSVPEPMVVDAEPTKLPKPIVTSATPSTTSKAPEAAVVAPSPVAPSTPVSAPRTLPPSTAVSPARPTPAAAQGVKRSAEEPASVEKSPKRVHVAQPTPPKAPRPPVAQSPAPRQAPPQQPVVQQVSQPVIQPVSQPPSLPPSLPPTQPPTPSIQRTREQSVASQTPTLNGQRWNSEEMEDEEEDLESDDDFEKRDNDTYPPSLSNGHFLLDPSLNFRICSLPMLENLASQILDSMLPFTVNEIAATVLQPETDQGQAFITLKALFSQTKRIYSNDPFLCPDELNFRSQHHRNVTRLINLATFIMSLFGSQEVGFFHLDEVFLEIFVPEGGRLLKGQGGLYLNLKTQAYISALELADKTPAQALDHLFDPNIANKLMDRRGGTRELIPSEIEFVNKVSNRREVLERLPAEVSTLRAEYPWHPFLGEIVAYVNKHRTAILLPTTKKKIKKLDAGQSETSTHIFQAQTTGAYGQAGAYAGQTGLQQQVYPGYSTLGRPSMNSGYGTQAMAIGGAQGMDLTSLSGAAPNPALSSGFGSVPHHPSQSTPTHILYEQARLAATARQSPNARRAGLPSQRRPWSHEEEHALMMGLDKVKGPHWSQILSMFGAGGSVNESLKDRNQVQLKDKARNLKLFFLKSGIEVPYYLQFVTGELKTRAPGQVAKNEKRKQQEEEASQIRAQVDALAVLSAGNGAGSSSSQMIAPPAHQQQRLQTQHMSVQQPNGQIRQTVSVQPPGQVRPTSYSQTSTGQQIYQTPQSRPVQVYNTTTPQTQRAAVAPQPAQQAYAPAQVAVATPNKPAQPTNTATNVQQTHVAAPVTQQQPPAVTTAAAVPPQQQQQSTRPAPVKRRRGRPSKNDPTEYLPSKKRSKKDRKESDTNSVETPCKPPAKKLKMSKTKSSRAQPSGTTNPDAEISFDSTTTLINTPSDTPSKPTIKALEFPETKISPVPAVELPCEPTAKRLKLSETESSYTPSLQSAILETQCALRSSILSFSSVLESQKEEPELPDINSLGITPEDMNWMNSPLAKLLNDPKLAEFQFRQQFEEFLSEPLTQDTTLVDASLDEADDTIADLDPRDITFDANNNLSVLYEIVQDFDDLDDEPPFPGY